MESWIESHGSHITDCVSVCSLGHYKSHCIAICWTRLAQGWFAMVVPLGKRESGEWIQITCDVSGLGSTPTRFRQSPVESADLTPRIVRFRTNLALVLAPSWPQFFWYELAKVPGDATHPPQSIIVTDAEKLGYALLALMIMVAILVPVSVAMVLVVPVAIVLVEIPVSPMVPMMIMFNSTAVSVPVTHKELLPIVMRRYPIGSLIRRLSPVALMPFVMPSYWIPIPLHPYELRSWWRRLNVNHARRRWRSDHYSNRNLRPNR